jgi:nucleotide-binding universal stress UspA family protein
MVWLEFVTCAALILISGSQLSRYGDMLAARIVKAAQRQKMDLVVIGSRGLTGFKKFFLGGVSHKVVKYSPKSVLVVR